MSARFKLITGLTIVMTSLPMLYFLKSNNDFLTLTTSASDSTISAVHEIFSCNSWKNLSYIDVPKYKNCLKQSRNDQFWTVHGLRHTSFKNLLNSSSLIIEVGGNTGLDTSQFITLYNPSIISFEPIVEMSKGLVEKFKTNPKIEIQPYGLGSQARNVSIELFDTDNAGTSIFRKLSLKNSANIQTIQLLNVVQVIENIRNTRTQNGIIDMISINCEGCEFEILPALIHSNMIKYFRIIQFGSHMNFLSGSSCIYCQIEQSLEQTHEIVYHYVMLWEAWILKNKIEN
ncbi:unnamed protein product [Rotaria socialis]|uniref:Methyltransferase FkbM domain-containing protein n=1 Tax=Rotaria socialis TaxID=392032 RepID=A0A818WD43_9BILA|nr:unnamed protein product [Rotaria socialis]CAF3378512.1 unnamed protein product [Rotaria socialis]CAF3708443.1 unnamed protein product [Rotaria socialis]CAF3723238.1 unnamed protein product [Rotaria socialis]CAF4154311.1 unnamed protein product [Rotaria socialis]